MEGYEFTTVRDLYESTITEGIDGSEVYEDKLIKRGVTTKWMVKDINEITSVEETFSKTGKLRINQCKVTTVSMGEKLVKMKYKDMAKLIKGNNKIGYGRTV